MKIYEFLNVFAGNRRMQIPEVRVAFQARLISLPEAEDRAVGRHRLLLQSSVGIDGCRYEAVVRDISLSGLLMDLDAELRQESQVTIELGQDLVRVARVAWVCGNLHGCTFEQPISPAEMKQIQSESRVIWPQFSKSTGGPHLRKSSDRVAHQDAALAPATVLTAPFPDSIGDGEEDFSHSFSPGRRLQIIFGLAAFSWTLVCLPAWLLLR
jgi:hypothetical protein